MNSLQFLLALGSLTVLALLLFIVIYTRENKLGIFTKFLFLGAVGWFIALISRIIPLQLMQALSLIILGANISDPQSVSLYSNNILVLLWGPIFAGIFEELFRYFIMGHLKNLKTSYKYGPLIFGLGWSLGEIYFLYIYSLINEIASGKFGVKQQWLFLFAGVFERITATIFHILMSFLVFYSLFEKKWKKQTTLWLAIIVHILFDFIVIIWMVFIPQDASYYIWSLELILLGFVAILAFILIKLWLPKKLSKLAKTLEEDEVRSQYE